MRRAGAHECSPYPWKRATRDYYGGREPPPYAEPSEDTGDVYTGLFQQMEGPFTDCSLDVILTKFGILT